MRSVRTIIAVIAIGLSSSVRLAGQAPPAVQAIVEDETRAAIVGARLTLTNTATHETRDASSDQSGRVVFDEVGPGQYELDAQAPGFQRQTRALTVTASPPPPVNLTLKIEVTENVSVTAARTERQPPSAVVLDRDTLDRVPVPPDSRQLTEFLANILGPTVQGSGGLSVVVDGIDVGDANLPSLAIKSLVVNKSPYSAEYRKPGKARVEVMTEDGSRRHFEWNSALFLGNSMLEARNVFATRKPDASKTLLDSAFGGPLARGRAAFLLTGEYLRDHQSRFVHAQTLSGRVADTVAKREESANLLGRLDVRLSDLTRLMIRAAVERESEHDGGVGGLRLPTLAVDSDQRVQRVQTKAETLLSASFANDVRVSFARRADREGAPAIGPRIIVRGAFEGGANQIFRSERSRELQVQDTATYVRGPHTFRFGGQGEARLRRVSDRSNFGGTFEFSSLDAFGAGTPSVFRLNQGSGAVDFSVYDANLFFQDEVRIGPVFTLTAGVRYDWQSSLADHDNLAPRVAFAAAPGNGQTVFRGGAGVFYERLSETILQRTLLFDGTRTRELVVLNSPYPDPFALGAGALTPASMFRLEPGLQTPSFLQASMGVERRILRQATGGRTPREMFLTAEYSSLSGLQLFRVRNVNAPVPGTGRRPDPNVLNDGRIESSAIARTRALSVGVTGRAWRFKGNANYTHSRSTNDVGTNLFRFPADNFDLASELGRADFDTRHKVIVLASFDLPGNGIELGAFATLASGVPFDITTGSDDNGDSEGTDRPAGVTRNTGQGPGFAQLDLRLWKRFRFGPSLGGPTEPRALVVRLDAFNVLNRTNYDRVVGVLSSPLFGQATSARTARSIQLSVRYRY